MSNVSSVNGPPPAYASIATQGGNLSPDALLAFCAAQLNGVDAQIKNFMDKQNQQSQFAQALTGLRNTLSKWGAGIDPNNEQARKEIIEAYREAFAAAPADQRPALDASFNKFMDTACRGDNPGYKDLGTVQPQDVEALATQYDHGNGNNGVNDGEFKTIDGGLDQLSQNMNQNNEMEMIQIQSLVSQRATFVQLTTGMMNKIDDSLQAIASNIK